MKEQENKIREILSSHTESIDIDSLWDKLEPHVPKMDKKRPIFLFWILFGGLTGLLILIWRNSDSFDIMKSNHIEYVDVKSVDNFTSNYEIVKNKVPEIKEAGSLIRREIKNAFNSEEFTKEKLDRSETIVDSFNMQNSEDKRVVDLANASTTISDSLIYKSEVLKNGVISLSNLEVMTEMIRHAELNTDSINYDADERKIDHARSEFQDIDALSLIQASILYDNLFELPSIKVEKISKFNLLFHVGIGISNMDETYRSKDVKLNLNENFENTLENINVGLTTSLKLKDRLSFQTGLQYSRFTSRVLHESNTYVDIVKDGTSQIEIDQFGNSTNIVGEIKGIKTINVKSKWYNYHRYLELPTHFRYLAFTSDRSYVFIDAGGSLLCFSKGDGAFVDLNDNLQKFETNTNPFNYQRFAVSGGLSWEYRMNNHGSIYSGLLIESRSWSRKASNVEYQQLLQAMKINIGYRIHF